LTHLLKTHVKLPILPAFGDSKRRDNLSFTRDFHHCTHDLDAPKKNLPAECREIFFGPSDRRKRAKNGMLPEKYRAREEIFPRKVAQIGNKSYFCSLKDRNFKRQDAN
jgi:hypothetical protein